MTLAKLLILLASRAHKAGSQQPETKMQAKLIQMVDGSMVVSTVDVNNILPAFEIRGYEFVRINQNSRQRAELQGLPVFRQLCGPMYDGPGFVRYEDQQSNDHLSI